VEDFFNDQVYITRLSINEQGLISALKNGTKLIFKNAPKYILGGHEKVEQIKLDIRHKDLEKLYALREKHLKRGLIFSSDDDFIPLVLNYGN